MVEGVACSLVIESSLLSASLAANLGRQQNELSHVHVFPLIFIGELNLSVSRSVARSLNGASDELAHRPSTSIDYDASG